MRSATAPARRALSYPDLQRCPRSWCSPDRRVDEGAGCPSTRSNARFSQSFPDPENSLILGPHRLPGRFLAGKLECGAIGGGELLDGHCGSSGDHLDEIVGAGEDAVAVVLGHVAQMLDEEGCRALCRQCPPEIRDVDRLVAHRKA